VRYLQIGRLAGATRQQLNLKLTDSATDLQHRRIPDAAVGQE
jgi:hypothetical protein